MRYLLIILAFVIALPAQAAEQLFLTTTPVSGGSRVEVYLAGTDESVNALEGRLRLPGGAAGSHLRTGESVVLHWIESPSVTDGEIRFAGIIPGGFTGTATTGAGLSGAGLLFSVMVSGVDGQVVLEDAAVFLNDGEGTKVPVVTQSVSVLAGESTFPESTDRTPPEWLTVERVHDPAIAEGRAVLIMASIDKDSGLDRFEVREGDDPWTRADSPYVLLDQEGIQIISVRAYDRAGNYREVMLVGERVEQSLPIIVFVFLALAVVALIVYVLRRRKKL